MNKNKIIGSVFKLTGCLAGAFLFSTVCSGININAQTNESLSNSMTIQEVKVTLAPARPNGDVTLDGIVNMDDAQLALKAALKIVELSPQAVANGDINRNGVIDNSDAQSILRIALAIQ